MHTFYVFDKSPLFLLSLSLHHGSLISHSFSSQVLCFIHVCMFFALALLMLFMDPKQDLNMSVSGIVNLLGL